MMAWLTLLYEHAAIHRAGKNGRYPPLSAPSLISLSLRARPRQCRIESAASVSRLSNAPGPPAAVAAILSLATYHRHQRHRYVPSSYTRDSVIIEVGKTGIDIESLVSRRLYVEVQQRKVLPT